MKAQKKIDKILEEVQNKVQDEVGGLMGASLALSNRVNALISKEDFFDQLLGKQIVAKMDVNGESEAKGCLLIGIKDAIRLGGTLIMLPPTELEEVIGEEEYNEETEDSYGEIANIIAGSYTKVFEELCSKSCRFIRKEQEVLLPMKVDVASEEPVPDGLYYQVTATMKLDDKQMGELIMLMPAEFFDLIPEEGEPVAAETAQAAEPAPAVAEDSPPEEPAPAEEATGAEESVTSPATSPKFDVSKHKKRIDGLLELCRGKVGEEVGAMLGVEVSLNNMDNRFVTKEDFFYDEVSGNLVVANMDVVGELEDHSYLFVGIKDAIFIGGMLIMLPPTELEAVVAEEDFSEDAEDAYGEIANIISGVYTAVFEEQYTKTIRFVKTDVKQVAALKVDVESDEPMAEQIYYMNKCSMVVDDKNLGNIQMLFPASMLQIDSLADQVAPEVGDSTFPEAAQAAAPVAEEAQAGEGTITARQSEGQTSSGVPGRVADVETVHAHDVLIISDDNEESSKITEVLKTKGLHVKSLSYKDNVSGAVTDELKAVFLVMHNVDEQALGMAIKISTVCSVPLIAAGAGWTRSKVIKAVKYGVRDILLTPASAEHIQEKIDNNLIQLAA